MIARCRALAIFALVLANAAPAAAQSGFEVSYAAGGRDAAGRFMGGTELRALVAHRGVLYAGLGYWEDRPGFEGPQGASILALDGPNAAWRVEHVFDERMPNGARRDFTLSALLGVTFATDGSGHALPAPLSMLLAASWDRAATLRVFSRDDTTGVWTVATLAQDHPRPNFLPQIRSLAAHRDTVTGVDQVFAGTDPHGVFRGVYDPVVPGRIKWDSAPEFDARAAVSDAFPGLEGRLRISSFAECNGRLYAAVGQTVFERIDGAAPGWRKVYTNPNPFYSQTGLRGLTAIANPSGAGQTLLAAVEGNRARIVRIDPRDGSEATELDLDPLLNRAWQTRVSYVIAAYNDMARVADPAGGEALVIGLEAFIPPASPRPPGHVVLDVVHGLEGGAWYLVRHVNGRYDLHQVIATLPGIGTSLVSVRAAVASPFAAEQGRIYFGGYDANGTATHNTAWVVRADSVAALTPPAARR